jgi:hypothetical protein
MSNGNGRRRLTIELEPDLAKLLDRLVGKACAKEERAVTVADIVRRALRSYAKAGA